MNPFYSVALALLAGVSAEPSCTTGSSASVYTVLSTQGILFWKKTVTQTKTNYVPYTSCTTPPAPTTTAKPLSTCSPSSTVNCSKRTVDGTSRKDIYVECSTTYFSCTASNVVTSVPDCPIETEIVPDCPTN